MTLLIGLGGLNLVAYFWVRQLAKGLHGSRRLRFGWVSVGDRLSEEFMISNAGSLPALWVEIVDDSNVPGYQAAVVRSVGAAATERWRGSAVCTRRGQYRLGPWALRTADPFGLFEVTIPCPGSEQIVIHPPIYSRAPVALPAGQSSDQARARSASQPATINAAGVRAYQPADPQRWIHWPTTARRDELFVRQFDLDAAGDIWLLLDMQQAVQLGQDEVENTAGQIAGLETGTEEFAVLLAATLSARALQQNRAIGLAAYGRQPQLIVPQLGQGQQWRLLQALAVVSADGENDLSRVLRDLSQLAKPGSAAIIITPSDHLAWLPDLLQLGQRSIRSHIVLLDRVSFGGDGKSAAMRDALRDLGFVATVVKQGELGEPLEEFERRGHWEFKVTGTGKAVAVRSPIER
jgi:uncharacterized protein (DUF58 family)